MIHPCHFPAIFRVASYASFQSSFIRNQQLNRVALLLAPQPAPLQRQQQKQHATLKITHKAITKFAKVGSSNYTGASAIFKLFQIRPALLEKRIKRPSPAVATLSRLYQDDSSLHDDGGKSLCGCRVHDTSYSGGKKKASTLVVVDFIIFTHFFSTAGKNKEADGGGGAFVHAPTDSTRKELHAPCTKDLVISTLTNKHLFSLDFQWHSTLDGQVVSFLHTLSRSSSIDSTLDPPSFFWS
jgi:hypothetical protein